MSGGGAAPTTLTATVVRSVESYPLQGPPRADVPPRPRQGASLDVAPSTRTLDFRNPSGLRRHKRVGVPITPRPPSSLGDAPVSSLPLSGAYFTGATFPNGRGRIGGSRLGMRPSSAPLKPLIVTTDSIRQEGSVAICGLGALQTGYCVSESTSAICGSSIPTPASAILPDPLPPAHQAALQRLVSEMTSRFLDAVREIYFKYRRAAEEHRFTMAQVKASHLASANKGCEHTTTEEERPLLSVFGESTLTPHHLPELPHHLEQYVLAVTRRNRAAVGSLMEAIQRDAAECGMLDAAGVAPISAVLADSADNSKDYLTNPPSHPHAASLSPWDSLKPAHRGGPGLRRSTLVPPKRRASSVASNRTEGPTRGEASSRRPSACLVQGPDAFPLDSDLDLEGAETAMGRLELLIAHVGSRHAWRRERTSYLSRCLRPLLDATAPASTAPPPPTIGPKSGKQRHVAVASQHLVAEEPTAAPEERGDAPPNGASIFGAVHESYLPPCRPEEGNDARPPSPTRYSLVRSVLRSITDVRERISFRGQYPIPTLLRHTKLLEHGTRRQKALLLQGLKGAETAASPASLARRVSVVLRDLVREFEEGVGARDRLGYGYEATELDLADAPPRTPRSRSRASSVESSSKGEMGITLPFPDLIPMNHPPRGEMCGSGTQTHLDDELMLYKQVRVGAMVEREKRVLDVLCTLGSAISNLVAFWGEEGLGVDVACPRCLQIGGVSDEDEGWARGGMCLVAPCGTSVCRRCLVPGRDDGTQQKITSLPALSGCSCLQHDGFAPAPKSTSLAQLYARSVGVGDGPIDSVRSRTGSPKKLQGDFDAVTALVLGGPAVAAAATCELDASSVLNTDTGDLMHFGALFPSYVRPPSRSSVLRGILQAGGKRPSLLEDELARANPPTTSQLLDLRFSLRAVQTVLGVDDLMDQDEGLIGGHQAEAPAPSHTSKRSKVGDASAKGRRHIRHRSHKVLKVVPAVAADTQLPPWVATPASEVHRSVRLDNPLSVTKALLTDPALREVARSTLQSVLRTAGAGLEAQEVARLARVIIHSEAEVTAALKRLRRV